MSSALDITRAANPPRAAFVDYPLGHTTGEPHDAVLQRRILKQALHGLATLDTPGSVLMLPFQWSAGDAWKDTAQRGPDDRLPRYETPQYQNEADRHRAEAVDPSCEACEVDVSNAEPQSR